MLLRQHNNKWDRINNAGGQFTRNLIKYLLAMITNSWLPHNAQASYKGIKFALRLHNEGDNLE